MQVQIALSLLQPFIHAAVLAMWGQGLCNLHQLQFHLHILLQVCAFRTVRSRTSATIAMRYL